MLRTVPNTILLGIIAFQNCFISLLPKLKKQAEKAIFHLPSPRVMFKLQGGWLSQTSTIDLKGKKKYQK